MIFLADLMILLRRQAIEKIETIGDAYMAACGLEEDIKDHAINCIKAAQQMLSYLEERNKKHEIKWRMRVGIHSGTNSGWRSWERRNLTMISLEIQLIRQVGWNH